MKRSWCFTWFSDIYMCAKEQIDRVAYISSLIGRPWTNDASCWHLACEVERALYGRGLPDVTVPENPSWRWIIGTIATHPERARWSELPIPAEGIVTAPDGALVLMASSQQPAHIGIWLPPEGGVLHADASAGVVLEGLAHLRARGWARLRFFAPVGAA